MYVQYSVLPHGMVDVPSMQKLGTSSVRKTDVEVGVMATVAELKRAVEYVFSHSPHNRHPYISWSHVWGHFCLCYEGQKLSDDKKHIRYLGIRDGDKLYFVRHLAINYKPDDKLTKDGSTATYKQIYIRILED